MDINSVLRKHDFHFQKRLGQNFITDPSLLRAVVCDADVQPTDTVIEVGMGAGTLTACLAESAGRVVGIEVDEHLRPVLQTTLAPYQNITAVFGDALKMSDERISELTHGKKYKLVANLPYYITTPLLFRFLYDENLLSLTVTVQKEVAERMCASAGSPEYGALSAQLALMGNAQYMRTVSRAAFVPSPNVDSAVVRLDISPRCDKKSVPAVKKAIAAAFAMRRKTLSNNLMAAYSINREKADAAISAAGLAPSVRGETLGIEQFILLSRYL